MASKLADKQTATLMKHWQHRLKLQKYVLTNIKIVNEDEEGAGRGAFGKVIDLDYNGTRCVGKVLHSIFFDPGTNPSGMQCTLERFYTEIELLSKTKHPNIVPFMGVFYQSDSSLPILVMKKMECGSLAQYLSTHEKGSITEDRILRILLDVSKGLVYLHEEMKVAHRDLSSNNVLLAADLSAKIADLGSARVLDRPGGWISHAKLTVKPGTQDFMPPETFEDPPRYTVSVDVFSFGCIIIHLCTHTWPQPINVPKGKFVSEIDRRKKYLLEMGESYLLRMVKQCLAEKGKNRPTSADLMSSLQAMVEQKSLNSAKQADYTIVFTGLTGTGKSTAGNFFFNKEVFHSGGGVLSVTKNCLESTSTICGKTVKIIDTPGFFDGFTATEGNFEKLSKVVTLAKEGIHALAFVMGRYTDSCELAIQQLLLFRGIEPFTFVLLTHVENKGKNEVTTKEYIDNVLSSPDCPSGFKDLMKVVKNRVIMLETVKYVASDYHEQKSKELISMIESLVENNENKAYSNGLLQFAFKTYEEAKRRQDATLREAAAAKKSNSERIEQLKCQNATTISSERNKEIAALEEANDEIQSICSEIEDPQYAVEVTEKILTEAMVENSELMVCNGGDKDNFAEFMKSFTAFVSVSAVLTPTSGVVYAGIGAGIGAIVGSFFPVIGTGVGAVAGARIGGLLGTTVAMGKITHSFWHTKNKGKTREGWRGVIDKVKAAEDYCKTT